MSRDRTLEPERARPSQSEAGRELPRGGRSGTKTRARGSAPADVRDALTQQLDLPRSDERERVWLNDREYRLRQSEVRTLAAVGAFRVVDAADVQSNDPWHGDLNHLREARLVEFTPKVLDGHRTTVVTLTRDGEALLERHQRTNGEERQAFYAGIVKPRELAHDARLYRAYATTAARLHEAGARVRRVVLDYELKRNYQRFLQANNHEHRRTSGRPDRSPEEIRAWADAHGLSVVDDRVQFPDVRVEYERADGRADREDIEVATEHYSRQQIAAKQAAGFQMQSSGAGRIGGGSARRGAPPFDPHAAAELLR
jgi:hypothetical protein